MRVRLQEVELGTQDTTASAKFYNSILGLDTVIDNENLKVFQSGVAGMDFNTSAHVPVGGTVISFLTDDLQTVIERLNLSKISFEGPKKSHLGMSSLEFKDPDGHIIRVNQPGDESPSWLTV